MVPRMLQYCKALIQVLSHVELCTHPHGRADSGSYKPAKAMTQCGPGWRVQCNSLWHVLQPTEYQPPSRFLPLPGCVGSVRVIRGCWLTRRCALVGKWGPVTCLGKDFFYWTRIFCFCFFVEKRQPPTALGHPPTAVGYLQLLSDTLQLSLATLSPPSITLRLPSNRRSLPFQRRPIVSLNTELATGLF